MILITKILRLYNAPKRQNRNWIEEKAEKVKEEEEEEEEEEQEEEKDDDDDDDDFSRLIK